jgi:hypothetical protein
VLCGQDARMASITSYGVSEEQVFTAALQMNFAA